MRQEGYYTHRNQQQHLPPKCEHGANDAARLARQAPPVKLPKAPKSPPKETSPLSNLQKRTSLFQQQPGLLNAMKGTHTREKERPGPGVAELASFGYAYGTGSTTDINSLFSTKAKPAHSGSLPFWKPTSTLRANEPQREGYPRQP